MTKLNPDPVDQGKTPMERSIEEALPAMVLTTTPVLIAGVNRKVNIGNFENVDVYCGISLPMVGASLDDLETLQKMCEDTAELGFGIVSEATGSRYTQIKTLQKGGRPDKPAAT